MTSHDFRRLALALPGQEDFVREHPEAFARAAGAWGRGGSTTIKLRAANIDDVREALTTAHRGLARKRKPPRA